MDREHTWSARPDWSWRQVGEPQTLSVQEISKLHRQCFSRRVQPNDGAASYPRRVSLGGRHPGGWGQSV
jgi:hypothetical protein